MQLSIYDAPKMLSVQSPREEKDDRLDNPPDHGPGLVRWLTQQFTEIEGVRVPLFAGVFAIFGHGNVTCLSEALESGAGASADLARAERAIDGARGDRVRQGQATPADHGRDVLDRARRAEHGDGGGDGACEPPAGAADLRRHFHQPAARSGDAAGRAFRRSDRHRERRVQGGDALLGPDHPSGADPLLAAAGGRHDARSRRLRPGLPRAAPGHSGTGVRLPAGVLRAAGVDHSASAPGPPQARRSRGAAEDREEADPDRRRRRALFAGREGCGGVRRQARHSDRRNHRRQGRGHALSSRARRADRHRRLHIGQCARGRSRRHSRRRHAAAGFHHRLMDGVQPGREVHLDQRRALRRGKASRASPWSATRWRP